MTNAQVEATLKPHMLGLAHLVNFVVSSEGKALIAEAAAKQHEHWIGLDRTEFAKRVRNSLELLASIPLRPAMNGEVDFSQLTKGVRDGLWAVCVLASSEAVKTTLPGFNVRLQVNEFDYASLAKALKKN